MRNGGYPRWFLVGWQWLQCRVFRKRCKQCNVTFSLLPAFVLAGYSYPRWLVVAWLWAALCGVSCRSRTFRVKQGVFIEDVDPRLSWSDYLDASPTEPTYQSLARWSRRFCLRATRLLPVLTSACEAAQVDAQSAFQSVATTLRRLPDRLNALAAAAGLIQGRRQAMTVTHSSVRSCMDELVSLLEPRPLPPKHNVLRASGGGLRYDRLVT